MRGKGGELGSHFTETGDESKVGMKTAHMKEEGTELDISPNFVLTGV
jgi:hypothetical protein